jgi:hypothetical protein
MADLGAAFGFYPQLNRRRQGSPADSANLPVDVLRGRLAGLLGLPADISNLLRSPSPTEMFGNVSYEAPAQFPYTTEKFLKDLPLAPTSRVGQVAGQAASFVPLNPMPAVRGVQKIGQMAGEELAATMMGQRPNSMMSKVVPQPLFAVAPEQGLLSARAEPIESLLQTKPQAPVSDIGFYSATEQAALNLGRNKGTGQSFINDLMKAPDVKKEELQFTGLDEFLRDKPNVTKQEVQDFLANNRVDVQEVRLGEAAAEDPMGIAKRKEIFDKYEPQIQALYKDMDSYGYDTPREVLQSTDNRLRKLQEMRDAEANAYYVIPESTPTRYQKYQLAGGENYREILLTLPAASDDALKAHRAAKSEALVNREKAHNLLNTQGYTPTAKDYEAYNLADAEWNRIQKIPAPTQSNYLSSHFDEPNILAHMRVNDRVDADGKKMLLVEEIQSDWHQAGREKGYQNKSGVYGEKVTPEEYKRGVELQNQQRNQSEPLTASEQAELSNIMTRHEASIVGARVPDAPFKDTWYQLALKRLTKYAADNGYERIGLTTGRQQAERFDLSKQISKIMWDKETGRLTAYDKNVTGRRSDGRTVIDESGVTEEKLSDYIGKEAAQKLIKETPDEEGTRFLSGLDLQVGGEGMKKYYDEIYPKFLDKYGKKYGASVGETKVNTVMERADNSMIPQMGQEPVRYLDITPQMKEGTSKGQPLFAATPLLPATSLLDEEKRKEITSLLE